MGWAESISQALDWIWAFSGIGALAAAMLCAAKPVVFQEWESWCRSRQGLLDSAAFKVWAVFFPLLIASYKLAQFLDFQWMLDSGVTANLVWNVAHGYGIRSSVIGDHSYFAVHFAFAAAFLAPMLWICNSVAPIAAVQGAAVGVIAWGVYRLARLVGVRAEDSWLMAFAAIAHPFFQGIAGAAFDHSVFALPLGFWALYSWDAGSRRTAALLGLLLLTTREQVPFMLAGFGAYLASTKPKIDRSLGLAVVIGAALIWSVQLRVIGEAQKGSWACGDNWGLFKNLGDSPREVFQTVLFRPWRAAAELVTPAGKLGTVFKGLGAVAFLPLASGGGVWPMACAWIPHQLSAWHGTGGGYQDLNAHSSAFVFGPLLWAAVHGFKRIAGRFPEFPRRLLSACVLLGIGAGFLTSKPFYNPRLFPARWRISAPKAMSYIPPDAKLWCDEYFLPHLGLRRYVKVLPRRLPDCWFEPGLFLPDYILLSLHWARLADPLSRDRILDFIAERGFHRVFQDQDLVVLTRDRPDAGSPPELARISARVR